MAGAIFSADRDLGKLIVLHLEYIFLYKQKIKIMLKEDENLKDVKDEVQGLVDAARNNFEVIGPHVQSWKIRMEESQETLMEFERDETFASSNPILRHSLGRKASKVAKIIRQLQSEGREICKFSSERGSLVFQSRMEATEEILSVLRSENNTDVICIYGTAGIGKTTIVQEIAKRAISELIFDEIAMVVVSQYTNVIEVQGQLAAVLSLDLVEQTDVSARAHCLHERLANGHRILLMLDNVYEALDMHAVGIPMEESCKVLVASRNADVCDKMGSFTFKISPLSGEEAWGLFKEIAGRCVDSPNLYPVAREVAKICEGVPLDIINWGLKLRNSKDYAWIDGLRELRLSAIKNNSAVDREAYSTIESIYNDLIKYKDKAKSLFRFCCQFSKDEEVEIELLIRYGLGLQWFEGKNITLVEAREGVEFFIKELIKCELLLVAGANKLGFVKVPDAAWYVGRDKLNEGRERNEYLLLNDSGLKESLETDKYDPYTTFPLYSNEMHELPDYLNCSRLKLLSFGCSHDQLEMSKDFFVGMKGLQVIDFRINILEPLPRSLKFLRNVRALYLDFCRLGDISLIGDLRELEILSFFRSEIGVLPWKIKKLKKLKMLDLRCTSGPNMIHYGLLSKLKRLEELYTGKYFDPYNVRRQNQRRSAKVVEIISLSSLKSLQISATIDDEFLRKFEKFEFKNLNEFDFSMFDVESLPVSRYHLSNRVTLHGVDLSRDSRNVNELMKKTEELRWDAVRRSSSIELSKEVFVKLRRLRIRHSKRQYLIADPIACSDPDNVISKLESLDITEVSVLVSLCNGNLPLGFFGRLEEMSLTRLPHLTHLWGVQLQLPSLSNLRVVNMQDCDAIMSLFTTSAVNCLVQLQELKIKKCKALKGVVLMENTEKMELPKLKILSISELPEFGSFCLETKPNSRRRPHHIADATENLFSKQVSLANMEELDVRNLNIRVLISADRMPAWSLNNLQVLRVFSCIPLVTVFDFQSLQIGGEVNEIIFNSLETMDLCDLPFLTNIWRKVPRGIQGFHSLKTLQVSSCGGMKYLLSISVAKKLDSLQELTIRNCETMLQVVGTDEESSSSMAETMDKMLFPKLRFLELEDLASLQMFYNGNHDVKFQVVEKISITSCPRMTTFCSGQVTTPQLERIHIKNYDLVEWVWKGDLNKTIEFLEEKGHKTLRRTKELRIESLGEKPLF